MSQRTQKPRKAGGLTLSLYARAPHPEHFTVLGKQDVARRAYEAQIWVVEGGHVVGFTAGNKHSLAEVIVNTSEPITEHHLIEIVPCRGEKYHEAVFDGGIKYMISTQEEQLSGTLYDATRSEISSYAAKRELMSATSGASSDYGPALSVLDIECRANELLVQSFHLFDETQMVIKTQSIIEVDKKALGLR